MLRLFELLIWPDEALPRRRVGGTLVAGIALSGLVFKLVPDRIVAGIAWIVIGIGSLVVGFRWQASATR